MTVIEFKNYVTNIYAACTQLEVAAKIPAGEGIQLARLIVTALMKNEFIDMPRT